MSQTQTITMNEARQEESSRILPADESARILPVEKQASCWDNFRTYVTVEPITFFYILSNVLSTTTIQQYASVYYATQEGGDPDLLLNTSLCDLPVFDNNTAFVTTVQGLVAEFLTKFSLMNYLPMVLASLLMGSYSDNNGRKIAMMLPVIGGIIRAGLSIILFYKDAPMEYFLLPAIIEGLFGGPAVFEMSTYAYVADISSNKERSWRMILLLIAQSAGVAIGVISVGYMITLTGFEIPLYLILCTYVVCLFIIIYYVRETIQAGSSTGGVSTCCSCSYLCKSLALLWKPDEKGRSTVLRMASVIVLLGFIGSGIMAYATYLYLSQEPVCFTWIEIGYLVGWGMIMTAAGSLLVYCLPIHENIQDTGVLLLSAVSAAAAQLWFVAPLYDMVYIYFQPVVGTFSGMIIPLGRAMMSNSVDKTDQGAVQSIASISSVLGVLIGSAGASAIYSATLSVFSGSVYVFGASVFILVLVLALLLNSRLKKDTSLKEFYVRF